MVSITLEGGDDQYKYHVDDQHFNQDEYQTGDDKHVDNFDDTVNINSESSSLFDYQLYHQLRDDLTRRRKI